MAVVRVLDIGSWGISSGVAWPLQSSVGSCKLLGWELVALQNTLRLFKAAKTYLQQWANLRMRSLELKAKLTLY
jgi:hypothetical protein